MRRHTPILAALAAATATVATIGFTATGASADGWFGGGLPQHVFAPYVETYDTSTGLAALSREAGARVLSLAFRGAGQAGSGPPYWNGDTREPISPASFGAD